MNSYVLARQEREPLCSLKAGLSAGLTGAHGLLEGSTLTGATGDKKKPGVIKCGITIDSLYTQFPNGWFIIGIPTLPSGFIKHGLLGNILLIGDFPIETSI